MTRYILAYNFEQWIDLMSTLGEMRPPRDCGPGSNIVVTIEVDRATKDKSLRATELVVGPITAEGLIDTVSRKELSEVWEVIKTRPLFRDNFGKYCGPDCDSVDQCRVAKMNALLKKN